MALPATIGDYLADGDFPEVQADHPEIASRKAEVTDRLTQLLNIQGGRTVTEIHRDLGRVMWDHVGMSRDDAGLRQAIEEIRTLREAFWQDVRVPGRQDMLNKNLELAGRVADYLELGELMARDALGRAESCGGHFREESQTPEGEALRDDENYTYAAAWEYKGAEADPELHKESIEFENVDLTQRSYK